MRHVGWSERWVISRKGGAIFAEWIKNGCSGAMIGLFHPLICRKSNHFSPFPSLLPLHQPIYYRLFHFYFQLLEFFYRLSTFYYQLLLFYRNLLTTLTGYFQLGSFMINSNFYNRLPTLITNFPLPLLHPFPTTLLFQSKRRCDPFKRVNSQKNRRHKPAAFMIVISFLRKQASLR